MLKNIGVNAGCIKSTDTWEKLPFCILIIVIGLYLINSFILPISHDEAYTAIKYAKNFDKIFDPDSYIANNHVFHSLLCWGSVSLFGDSLFFVRLPALIGSFVFFLCVFLCGRILFNKDAAFSAIALLLIGLNPLCLNYFSSARGYSLAAAFSLLAFYILLNLLLHIDFFIKNQRKLYVTAGLCLALSVSSNLTFVFPNIAIVLLYIIFEIVNIRVNSEQKSLKAWSVKFMVYLVLPGFLITSLLLYKPVFPNLFGGKNAFYFGEKTVSGAINSLFSQFEPEYFKEMNLFGDITTTNFSYTILFILLLIIGMASIKLLLSRKRKEIHKGSTSFHFLLLVFFGFILMSYVFHKFFGILYPRERTGFYYVIYGLLLFLSAGYWLSESVSSVRNTLILILLIGCVGYCVNLPYFYKNQSTSYNNGIKEMFSIIQANNPEHEVQRVGVHWRHLPAAEYYKHRNGMLWLYVDKVRSFSQSFDSNKKFDYFILFQDNAELADKKEITELYSKSASGIELVKVRQAVSQGISK